MFALHAGIAIQNARLHQEVQKLAVVDERLRISRDLHDGIIQSLYAVSLSLEDVADLIADDTAEAEARVDRAIDRLHTTIGDIRTFIVGLGTEAGSGLGGAVESMAHELLDGTGIDLALDLVRGCGARRSGHAGGRPRAEPDRPRGRQQRRPPQRRAPGPDRAPRRGRRRPSCRSRTTAPDSTPSSAWAAATSGWRTCATGAPPSPAS